MTIARAIVTDPALILADERTGNVDAASADEVLTLLSHRLAPGERRITRGRRGACELALD